MNEEIYSKTVTSDDKLWMSAQICPHMTFYLELPSSTNSLIDPVASRKD